MSAPLARLLESGDAPFTLVPFPRAHSKEQSDHALGPASRMPLAPRAGGAWAASGAIDLGTCVLVSLSGGWSKKRSDWARAGMTEEGVVIEVVPPGCATRSARVVLHARASSRSSVPRYVVQCWTGRVLRRAQELMVVCP